MKTQLSGKSPLFYARVAGILYLVITVAAMIAHFYVPSELIVAGDAAATADRISASESLFRFGGLGSEIVILLSELFLTIVLYVLLKPVSKILSLTAAVSRLVMTTIHGLNLLNYFFVLQLLDGQGFAASFDPVQLQSLMSMFLYAHSYGFTLGLVFFVPHVFILGYLIYRSGYFPKVLGILFLVAGFGYLIDTSASLLVAGYQETPIYLALPIMISEIAFPLWLLIKGLRTEQYQQQALVLESA